MNLKSLRDDIRGNAIVEFAVSLPIFFLWMFGAMQVGLMMWAQVGLQHGVEAAAQCASLSDAARIQGKLDPSATPTPCYTVNGNATANASSIASYAATQSSGFNPPASVFSASYNSASPACTGGNLVTATYPFTALRYIFSITLTAQACYPTTSPPPP